MGNLFNAMFKTGFTGQVEDCKKYCIVRIINISSQAVLVSIAVVFAFRVIVGIASIYHILYIASIFLLVISEICMGSMSRRELAILSEKLNKANKYGSVRSKLRKAERRFSSIADRIPDIFWETSKHFKITYINRTVTRILGYEPAELLGVGPFFFLSEEEAEKKMKCLKKRIRRADKSKKTEIYKAYAKNGDTVYIEIVSSLLFDRRNGSKKFLCAQWVARDITGKQMMYKKRYAEVKMVKSKIDATLEKASSQIQELSQSTGGMV